jgi:hypothetical protein
MSSADSSPRCWRDPQGLHIDVRGLAPPQPMVAILQLLQRQGHAGGTVFAHLDREPLMLYPELATLGWRALQVPAGPDEVLLRLEFAP